MNQLQLKAYLETQGIEHTTTGKGLRVMDKSLLPQSYRDLFDERGYLVEGKMDKKKQDEEAAMEAARLKTKELDKVSPMGETEKEMTTIGLLNPDADTVVPSELEDHTGDPGDVDAVENEEAVAKKKTAAKKAPAPARKR
jgi:hypothetical protein